MLTRSLALSWRFLRCLWLLLRYRARFLFSVCIIPMSRAVVVELFAVTIDSRRRILGFMFAMVAEAHDVMI